MVEFVCDSCHAMKRPEETWILGLAAEAVGVSSASREISIVSAWDRERAVHRLAVHFCSTSCKDEYIARLFGNEPLAAKAIFKKRISPGVKRSSKVRRSRPKPKVA